MSTMVNRKFGTYYPLGAVSGGSYSYNFPTVEAQVGRTFDTYSTFLSLSSDYPGNPNPPGTRKQHADIAAAAAAGHDIVVALDTVTSYVLCTDSVYRPVYATGADIRAGTFNTQMGALFDWLLSLGVPISIRFMWEMNLTGNVNYPGYAASLGTGTPTPPAANTVLTSTGLSINTSIADFKLTWQYVYTFLKTRTNGSLGQMFYCPNAGESSSALAAGNSLAGMYPGDAYVDIVGYDSYNTIGTTWTSASDTMRGLRTSDSTNPYAYDLFASTVAPSKPIWIGETNSMDMGDSTDTTNTASGHSKAQWYTDLFAITDLPNLVKVIFFDSPGVRQTWPFDSSSASLSAFKAAFSTGVMNSFTFARPIHASRHASTGADPITPASIGAVGLSAGAIPLALATTTPTAPSAEGGVMLYSQADSLKVRNNGLIFTIRPAQVEQLGTVACAYDPVMANTTSSAMTAGVIYLVRITISDARTLSRVGFNIVTAGSTLTVSQCFAGVYDNNGNLLGQTADQSTVWTSAGAKNMALTAVTSLAVEPGNYYAAFLSNGTTGPAISKSSGLGTWLQSPGVNLRFGQYGSGQTSLPTMITPASIAATTDNKFASIS